MLYRIIKKSVVDEILVCLLKDITDLKAKPLTYNINLAFCAGTYPQQLKLSNVKCLDLSREFDTEDHDVLSRKLEIKVIKGVLNEILS